MRASRTLFILSLLSTALLPAHADEPPYSIERSEARVLRADGRLSVAFGPVQFVFPSDWSLGQERNPWKVLGPNKAVAWVSVLAATESTLRAGVLSPQRLERAKIQLTSEAADLCASAGIAPVEAILVADNKVIFAAGCEERAGSEVQFALRYEIYSPTGIVQLTAAGIGSRAFGRQLLDPIALSHAW